MNQIIIFGLLYLFLTLPFAVEGFSIYWMVLNRIIFFLILLIGMYSYAKVNNYVVIFNLYEYYLILFIVYSYCKSLYFIDTNYIHSMIKIFELMGIYALIWFIYNIYLFKKIIKIKNMIFSIITIIVLFYSLDVIIQALLQVDLFGFVNHFQNRYWGAFQYGAPSFGVYIVSFLFLPFVLHEGFKKYILFMVFFIAMLLSNDRAPLLIMIFSLLLYLFIKNKIHFLIFIGFIIISFFIVINYFYDFLPYRIQMLFDLLLILLNDGVILDVSQQQEMSVTGYLNIWISNITFWFSLDNFTNLLFGSGFGNLREILNEATGYPRIHNMLLEIFMTFGLIGTIILIGIFKRLFKYKNKSLLLVLPYFTPFLFFSLYSLNQIILFLVSFLIYILYNEKGSKKCVQ